mgnify:CR=1 FL=1
MGRFVARTSTLLSLIAVLTVFAVYASTAFKKPDIPSPAIGIFCNDIAAAESIARLIKRNRLHAAAFVVRIQQARAGRLEAVRIERYGFLQRMLISNLRRHPLWCEWDERTWDKSAKSEVSGVDTLYGKGEGQYASSWSHYIGGSERLNGEREALRAPKPTVPFPH